MICLAISFPGVIKSGMLADTDTDRDMKDMKVKNLVVEFMKFD